MRTAAIVLKALSFVFLISSQNVNAQATQTSEGQKFQIEVLTQQKDVIWGFDFLSNDKIIFTERQGALKTYDLKSKKVSDIKGAPQVWSHGQGGLLDVRVHPTDKNKIFLTYSEPVGKKATTALGSAKLSSDKLENFKKLFSAVEPGSSNIQFGSRIEFDGHGHIIITVGDRDNRSHVQDLKYHTGKTIRLNEDGTVPKDNPFVKNKNAQPEIYSLGHRSPEGLVLNQATGDLWEAEMGPLGGDELNIIRAGANYGWPVVTYGREYSGPKIGEGTTKSGMEDPVAYWVPSISPSGITIYDGDVFPKWKGNIFVGNLSGQHLRRLVLDGKKVIKQEELLKDQNLRFRNVRSGPDGFLYFSTDDGKLARLIKADK